MLTIVATQRSKTNEKACTVYCLDTLIAMKRYNWLTEWLPRLAKFDKRCTKQYQSVAPSQQFQVFGIVFAAPHIGKHHVGTCLAVGVARTKSTDSERAARVYIK